MDQDVYQYLQWLQTYIQAQERRIVTLEKSINQLNEEMTKLQERKTIHVDKIEYKFDQLKVETLEGTLNIGLNPSDLSAIEDFTVENQSLNTPSTPKAQMQRSMKIEEAIFGYLETDLPQIIEETQKRLRLEPSDSYLSFIKEDIIKQLPTRIEFHQKAQLAQNRSPVNGTDSDLLIIEALKQEIHNGVFIFLNHLPENVKGMSQNEL